MNEKCFALPIEKQQRILDAAYQAFFKCGYQGASLSEIASNAGISNVCPDVDLLQSRSGICGCQASPTTHTYNTKNW